MAADHQRRLRAMSIEPRFLRTAAYVTIGALALLAGCDRDTPTDVAAPTARLNGAPTPSFAVTTTAGKPGQSSYEKNIASLSVNGGNEGIIEVFCTSGKRALGGGFQIVGGVIAAGPDVVVYESAPRVTGPGGSEGWRLDAMNRTSETRQFDVYVICATI
jgi:hypothetical protein